MVTRREAIDLAYMAVSLAALIARTVALALADLDRGLRSYAVEIPSVIPEYFYDDIDLP